MPGRSLVRGPRVRRAGAIPRARPAGRPATWAAPPARRAAPGARAPRLVEFGGRGAGLVAPRGRGHAGGRGERGPRARGGPPGRFRLGRGPARLLPPPDVRARALIRSLGGPGWGRTRGRTLVCRERARAR